MPEDHLAVARKLIAQDLCHEAAECCQKAIALDSNDWQALELLSEIYIRWEEPEKAIEFLRQAIHIHPQHAQLHIQLGILHASLKRHEEAVLSFKRVLALEPNHVNSLENLGLSLGALLRNDEALRCFEKAVALDHESPRLHHNLGISLAKAGAPAKAIESLERAIRVAPGYVEAYVNLASLLNSQQEYTRAAAECQKAIQADPNHVDAYCLLAEILLEQRQPDEAIVNLERALRIGAKPLPKVLNLLGLARTDAAQFKAAIDAFDQALDISPSFLDALLNAATAKKHLGQLDKAIADYELALTLAPENESAHWNLALALLQSGQFERGFSEYEWRLKKDSNDYPAFDEPRWQGEPIDGKRVLLSGEQGLGDSIQFIRYADRVKKRGAHVIVRDAAYLLPLLSFCDGVDEVTPDDQPAPVFDVHAPLMSLPYIFGDTENSLPDRVPYMKVDHALYNHWRNRIAPSGKFKIGIVWQGNPHHAWDHYRSVPLKLFRSLAELPNTELVSLQRTHGLGQLSEIQSEFSITVLSDELDGKTGAFLETAAIVSNLDLVVTIDSAMAHLSGALGQRTWLLLSAIQDWRWLRGREDSPWYPSLRIFRQSELGDWEPVIGQVAEAISKLGYIHSKHGHLAPQFEAVLRAQGHSTGR